MDPQNSIGAFSEDQLRKFNAIEPNMLFFTKEKRCFDYRRKSEWQVEGEE
jgi:hypothetical protein